MKPIQMVDLQTQYFRLKSEIDKAIHQVLEESSYINGPAVKLFQENLEKYLNVHHVIPCANGTDALQIALMSLDLSPEDEIIVPAFTYVATAEVAAVLGLKIVLADVDPETFNITASEIEKVMTNKSKVIVPVHLYGQSCDMEPIMKLAKEYNLYVIEDNAQSIGADYTFSNGSKIKTGVIGDIGCTSFYPSKNLGAYGDGGAIFTNNTSLAEKIKMIANHGQKRRYYHDVVGVNSRLDSIQAAILNIKLSLLDDFSKARNKAATYYDLRLSEIEGVVIPKRQENSTHVFHQYTMKVPADKRDNLQAYLQSKGIPTMIYYPLPLYKQKAFENFIVNNKVELTNTEELCKSVISLPMHSELEIEQLDYICDQIKLFFV